jgi:hypothetical protein
LSAVIPISNSPKRTPLSLADWFRRLIGLEATPPGADKVSLCLTIAFLYALGCAGLALRQVFASKYALADDAREHVFWMFRFLDPRLFPNDPMADYFQSLAPLGYARFYWLLAQCGIDPLLASKLIPSALSLIATGYFFGFARRFFRSPGVASFTTILFVQCLWLNSDLSSATPRAFFYPIFVAFLYYQQRDSFIGILSSIGLAALFFPPTALVSLGVLGFALLRWENGPRLAGWRDARAYQLVAAASFVILVCLMPYLTQTRAFGPLVSCDQARQMSEFGPAGRVPFFFPSWWGYWVAGNGGIHTPPTRPQWFLAAFLWPLLRRFPGRFPLLNQVPRGARPIPWIIAASLSFFFFAHLFLFHLYLPNRYTAAVTRVVLILLDGGILLALVDAVLRWTTENSARRTRSHQGLTVIVCAALLGFVLCYPLLLPAFPTASYVRGADPNLYRFLERQPIAIRIATLADKADNIPTLSHRSVVISAECAVPFHPGYYLPLRNRGLQIARAQYSADPAVVEKVVRDQKIDFWLLDSRAFSPDYWERSRLLRQLRLAYPAEDLGPSSLRTAPFLEHPPPESVAYHDQNVVVLDTHHLFVVAR